jgi:hypothetical protein
LRRLTIGQVFYELRRRFFGGELEEAPKDKERKERAYQFLLNVTTHLRSPSNTESLASTGKTMMKYAKELSWLPLESSVI